MGKTITPLNTSGESGAYYEERWPPGGIYYEPVSGAPPLFQKQCSGLLANSRGVVVIASGSSGGQVGWNFNFVRVGEKNCELKLDPALVLFSGDAPALSHLLHHAKSSGRRLTISLSGDSAAFDTIRNGGWCPVSGLLTTTSGLIVDLRSPLLDAAYSCAAAPLASCLVSG
jgi:hypothetical protein